MRLKDFVASPHILEILSMKIFVALQGLGREYEPIIIVIESSMHECLSRPYV